MRVGGETKHILVAAGLMGSVVAMHGPPICEALQESAERSTW